MCRLSRHILSDPKMVSLWLLIFLAATYHWLLQNAFLDGIFEEKVYMEQPPGFVTQEKYDKVCHVQKSLYGLKQSARAWFRRFGSVVNEFGFYCFQIFPHQLGKMYYDHVDDIITGYDVQRISNLKLYL